MVHISSLWNSIKFQVSPIFSVVVVSLEAGTTKIILLGGCGDDFGCQM